MLAILLGCGLRRREVAELTFDSLKRREERWAIVDLVGKGRHIRVHDSAMKLAASWSKSSSFSGMSQCKQPNATLAASNI
jgi:hypothetical protein